MGKKRYVSFCRVVEARKQTYEFSNKQVSNVDLEKILDVARWAPNCSNVQPWRFIIVRNKDCIQNLIDKATWHIFFPFIRDLPSVIIAFVLDEKCILNGKHVCSENPAQKVSEANLCLAMCVDHAVLAAASLGISACILTPKKTQVRAILKTNESVSLIVGFGYESPKAFKRMRTRKSLKELILKTIK